MSLFENLVIGSAVADLPAVMTAAGWKLDDAGNWELKPSEASSQLADNLAILSMFAEGAPAQSIVTGLYDTGKAVVTHPVQTTKAITKLVSKPVQNFQLALSIKRAQLRPEVKLYSQNPILLEVGSVLDYINYANSIFPNSKFNNVVYHGGKSGIRRFKAPGEHGYTKADYGTLDYGIYFAKNPKLANRYRIWSSRGKNDIGSIYPVRLNILSGIRYDNPTPVLDAWSAWNKSRFTPDAVSLAWYDRLKLKNYDAIIQNKSLSGTTRGSVVVFDPKNIHILGNIDDVQGFKTFMKNPRNINTPVNTTFKNLPNLWNISPKNILSDINANKWWILGGTASSGVLGFIGKGFYDYWDTLNSRRKSYLDALLTGSNPEELYKYYELDDPNLTLDEREYLTQRALEDGIDFSKLGKN